jgi:hypothetical protein
MMDKKEAVKRFNEIRDIPYHISVEGEKGSDCLDKATMLVPKLRELGYQADSAIGLFRWSSLNLTLDLTEVDHDDFCSHMFVQILNDKGEICFIDPTWNPELGKAGFDITEWDGSSSTNLAVPCYRILSLGESEEYLAKLDNNDDMAKSKNFYKAFNEYCDSFLEKKGE